MDAHMAVDGANMSCVDCHRGKDHLIPGNSVIAVPHLFGKGGFRQTYDWKALGYDGDPRQRAK